MSTLVSQGFDKALNDAIGQPRGRGAVAAAGGGGRADEGQARQLLDFYRAQLATDLPRPLLACCRTGRPASRPTASARTRPSRSTSCAPCWRRRPTPTGPSARWSSRSRWPSAGPTCSTPTTRAWRWRGDERRAELLEEAARIAKDFTRRRRARHRLPRPAVPDAARGRRRSRRRSSACSSATALGRAVAVLAAAARDADRRRGARAAPAARDHAARRARPARRGARRGPAPSCPTCTSDAPLARLARGVFVDERAPAETRLEALDALRGRARGDGRAPRAWPSCWRWRSASRRASGCRRCDASAASGCARSATSRARSSSTSRSSRSRPRTARSRIGLRQLAELARDAGAPRARPHRGGARQRRRRAAGRAADARRAGRRSPARPQGRGGARCSTRRPPSEAGAARAAAGGPAPAGGAARRARRRAGATRRPRAPGGGRAQARRQAPRLGPGRGAGASSAATSIGRSPPGSARLALDPADAEALAASRALLLEAERWPALIDLLRRRVDSAPAAHQVRADLVEIATLARTRTRDLGTRDRHLARDRDPLRRGRRLRRRAGRSARRERPLRRAGRAARAARGRRSAACTPIGWRAWATPSGCALDDARGAIGWYGRALEVEPAHEAARAGLTALLTDAALAPHAAGRWRARPSGPTAGSCCSTSSRTGWRRLETGGARAAPRGGGRGFAEERAGDRARAFAWLCQALPLAGENLALEREVLRLAEATGGFAARRRGAGGAIAARRRGRRCRSRTFTNGAGRCSRSASAISAARARQLRGRARPHARAPRAAPQPRCARRSASATSAAAAALLVDAARLAATRATTCCCRSTSRWPARRARSRPRLPALAHAADQAADLEPSARRELHARVAATLLGECQDPAAADAALGAGAGRRARATSRR